MEFPYSELGAAASGGYERLLVDVTHGDQTLFIRGDEAEEAWRVLDPLLKGWEAQPAPEFPNYAAGTMGPDAADRFIAHDGRRWRTLGK
jgi:glucose-6-phosphate 1-dehydrogenase